MDTIYRIISPWYRRHAAERWRGWIIHVLVTVLPLTAWLWLWIAAGDTTGPVPVDRVATYYGFVFALLAVSFVRIDHQLADSIRSGGLAAGLLWPMSYWRMLVVRVGLWQGWPLAIVSIGGLAVLLGFGTPPLPASLGLLSWWIGYGSWLALQTLIGMTAVWRLDPSAIRNIARLGLWFAVGVVVPFPLIFKGTWVVLGPWATPVIAPFALVDGGSPWLLIVHAGWMIGLWLLVGAVGTVARRRYEAPAL